MNEPLARRLAGRVGAIARDDLPPEVLERAALLLHDYVGVAIGGALEPSSLALRRGLVALGAIGTGTVLGTRDRFPAPQAALANGAAAHALEMDDTHNGGSVHLGATVFSAALAAAELRGGSGDTVLRAAVAGYEVAARIAMAIDPAAHYRRGFHPTGTCGAFGAAAATGVVFRLDETALATALGIAGSQAAGLMEFLADGSWTKRLHPGWAALAGLHAATFAEAGFRAPATVLEGRAGFLRAYSDAAKPAPILAHDGYELMQTGIKPHACCRYAQGAIDATLALRATHAVRPKDVERIEVGVLGAAVSIICEPAAKKRRPASVVDAQFSLPFAVAIALTRGAASPAEFVPEAFADPTVVGLMEKVVAIHDPALDAAYPRAWPCWVRLWLRGGRTEIQRVEHPRGDPENFPGPTEFETKLRTLAGRTLAPDAVERLVTALGAFPRASGVHELLAAATADG